MAKVYGGESKSIIDKKEKNRFRILSFIGITVFLIFVYFYYIRLFLVLSWWISLILLLGWISVFKLLFTLLDKSRIGFFSALNGLDGEMIVRRELAKLPNEYVVFHGLKLREPYDVDFVVVGPTGIFAIDAKSHRGRMGYDGEELTRDGNRLEKNILFQTMSEALDVHTFLLSELQREYFVKPVIVFSSSWARISFGNNDKKGVCVIGKKWLRKIIIENDAEKLSREALHAIEEVLRKKEKRNVQVEK
ncbi:MAG TPA: nuclease-related domain-containing protein [Candidatus Magasanikbacteria bacterium]|nr:nuclease-related domain-containing protein [Candidatus Magasanikbacteria bacterium]